MNYKVPFCCDLRIDVIYRTELEFSRFSEGYDL